MFVNSALRLEGWAGGGGFELDKCVKNMMTSICWYTTCWKKFLNRSLPFPPGYRSPVVPRRGPLLRFLQECRYRVCWPTRNDRIECLYPRDVARETRSTAHRLSTKLSLLSPASHVGDAQGKRRKYSLFLDTFEIAQKGKQPATTFPRPTLFTLFVHTHSACSPRNRYPLQRVTYPRRSSYVSPYRLSSLTWSPSRESSSRTPSRGRQSGGRDCV